MRKGFNLIETMIAVALVSCCLLMMTALFIYMFKSSQKGVDLTMGSVVGSRVLDKFVEENRLILNDFGSDPAEMSGSVSVNGNVYFYTVKVTSKSDPDMLGPAKMVSAQVSWFDQKDLTEGETVRKFKDNYGALSCTVNKIVYCR